MSDYYDGDGYEPNMVVCRVCGKVREGYTNMVCHTCDRKAEAVVNKNKKYVSLKRSYKQAEKRTRQLEKAKTKLYFQLEKKQYKEMRKKRNER